MGKSIIVPNVLYSTNNLGKINFLDNANSNVFNIIALENITVSFPKDLYYRLSENHWELYKANNILTLKTNQRVAFKANLIPNPDDGIGTFIVSGMFSVQGNICSLINYEPIRQYSFKYLFRNCTGLLNADNLQLAPDIAQNCYEGMFKGCTSLYNTPVLSCPILVNDCYKEMFYGCTSLEELTVFCETQLGELYSNNWVYGVSLEGIVNQSVNITYTETGVNGIPSGWILNKSYEMTYFTIESLDNNNKINIQNVDCTIFPMISYSIDNGLTWNDIISDKGIKTIATINQGDIIIFKGYNKRISLSYNHYNRFNCSKAFKVYGNIMSLLYGDEFGINTEFDPNTSGNFAGLFFSSSTLTDASNLVLPAKECVNDCYNCMFNRCINLAYGPKILPATIAKSFCYSSMFENCINLEEAPEISLTVLAENCCNRMFCMSTTEMLTTPKLIKSPILKSTTGANNCYRQMFQGNGNLIEVTCLLITSDTSYTNNWLSYVSQNGILYKNPLQTWTENNSSSLPTGWTVQDYVEE